MDSVCRLYSGRCVCVSVYKLCTVSLDYTYMPVNMYMSRICIRVYVAYISRGRWGSRQLGGFSVVVVIVALFVPNVCPVGGGKCGLYSESP